jgi:hypothetical protein
MPDIEPVSITSVEKLTATNVMVIRLQASLKKANSRLFSQSELEKSLGNQTLKTLESEEAREKLQGILLALNQ